MEESRNGGASHFALALILGLIVVAANAAVVVRLIAGDWGALQALIEQRSAASLVDALGALYQGCAGCVIYLGASPLILALLTATLGGGRTRVAKESKPSVNAEVKPSGDDALRLLRLLQEEARFVDFIEEDLDSYDDAQVGAAARSIHSSCRKALQGRIAIERIYYAAEGSSVDVEEGFNPASIRLTGNVSGTPPFSGTLQHAGWRATKVTLPESPGGFDNSVIAPAEVEIA
jgi:hypothetical protein